MTLTNLSKGGKTNGFFSKLGDSIVSATQEVGEKAKGMTDVAKLQYEMRSKEDF